MKWSWVGRASMAVLSAMALGLGMTACGGHTIAYLWTVGTQYNQIHGFKVDDYTGNLTAVQNSPFAGNGSVPVDIVAKPSGRYVYVVEQGTPCSATVTANCTGLVANPTGGVTPTNAADSGIAVYSVGGDGALTYQMTYPSQGAKHLWAQFDASGNYLFVLDQYSPTYNGGTDSNGAITVFTVDPNTGRLSIDPQTASVPSNGTAPLYLEVGTDPLRMQASAACLFTLNSADQTITPYNVASGQLTPATTGKIPTNTVNASSIYATTASSYLVVTDAGVPDSTGTYSSTAAYVHPYTIATGCGLTPFSAPFQTNVADPVNSFISTNNNFLYILNGATSNTAATSNYSTISGYNIQTGSTTTQLGALSESPFPAGSGPDCMVEDPTQKFIYTSNRNDGTLTGYILNNNEGTLQNLSRGSTFQTNDTGSVCLALSGSVD